MLEEINKKVKPTCFQTSVDSPVHPLSFLMFWDVVDYLYQQYLKSDRKKEDMDMILLKLLDKYTHRRKSIYAQSDDCLTFICSFLS